MSDLDAYATLRSIIHLSISSAPVEAKLDQMLPVISEAFQSDRCLFFKPEKMARDGFLSRLAAERKPLWVDGNSPLSLGKIPPEEEDLISPAFACFPLYDETFCQGILYVGFSKNREFTPQETDLLLLVSKEMQMMIRSARLQERAEKSVSELTALQEMGNVIASTLKLEELFKRIVENGIRILKAKGGILRVRDSRTGELMVRFSIGDYHQDPLDEKIAKRVFHTQLPLFLNYSEEEHRFRSVLCAPFLSQGKSFGTLAFYDAEGVPSEFDDVDFQLLQTLASQVSSSVENALAHRETSSLAQKHEKMAGQLSILWELSKALLTTMNVEMIMGMTLTAITMKEGLGFNRAMLFLINEKTHALDGTRAVGPDNAEEAGRIWATLSQKKGHPLDLMAQVRLAPESNSVLNSIMKGIRIPLEHEHCILVRTVFEGRPFNFNLSQQRSQTPCGRGCSLGPQLGCYVGEQLSENPKVHSFAVVPLWGKGKIIGVILVDNLYNRNRITEEDIHFLSMFSNQAGLAIENASLYRNLEEVHQKLQEAQTLLVQNEKRAALGEMSSTVAHQIKNPLVSIGGFARRLDRSIQGEAPERRYAQTIIVEVARLESILNNILDYTRADKPVFRECDLREVLEDSLSMISEGLDGGEIKLVKEFDGETPKITGDPQQLKQAFFNLIANARQAMGGEGTLSLRVYPLARNDSSNVRVEVKDTGKGIEPENLHHIFNPFYTTKESGSGLGLPIVHRIVTSHQGLIEVDNQPGKGVNFIVTLPVIREENGKRVNGLP